MKIFYSVVLSLFLVVAALPASADVFVWKDADTGVKLSFPDNWARVHNQKTDDIITIAAPDRRDYASCRVRVRADERYMIYPRKYDANIQRLEMSKDFWFTYFGEYDGVIAHRFYEPAGLGDAFASGVEISFITPGQPRMLKRGIVHAGLVQGRQYIFECSAESEAYDKWRNVFKSVLKSVRTEDVVFDRRFVGGSDVLIENGRSVDRYSY